MKKLLTLLVIATIAQSIFAQQIQCISETTSSSGLKHPGCLQSAAEINALATALTENDPYRTQLWDDMIGNARGRIDGTSWVVPEELFGTNFGDPAKLGGAGLIRYVNDWIINGNKTSEDAAIKILNSWSAVKSFTPDPEDSYKHHRLAGGMYLGYIAHAADLLMSSSTSWPVAEQEAFKTKLRNIILPIINEDRAVGFNANWDLGCTWSVMAIAVCLDDKVLFDEQVEWLKNGDTNARISYYLLSSGQTQETARDQLHVAMGLTHLQLAAQIACTQGIDLYEYDNRSVGKALEYFAAYNLGENNLPFQVYPCAVGSNSAHDYNLVISESGKPNYDAIFEMVYHHYKNYRNTELPYTKKMLEEHTRPEGPGARWSNHSSALFWNLDMSFDAPQNPQPADVSLDINPDYNGRAWLRLNCGGAHYGTADGRAFTKERGKWQQNGTNVKNNAPIANTTEQGLYQTYRQGGTTGSVSYNFPMPNGKYRVIIHFAEPSFEQNDERLFNVYLEGNKVLDSLDIFAVAGKNTAYIYDSETTLSDGVLNVELESVKDRPVINAIEIEPYFPHLHVPHIENKHKTIEIKTFPNPNDGNFTINIQGVEQDYRLEIYNMLGQLMYKESYPFVKNQVNKIDISGFTPGLYLVKVIAGNDLKTQKVLVR